MSDISDSTPDSALGRCTVFWVLYYILGSTAPFWRSEDFVLPVSKVMRSILFFVIMNLYPFIWIPKMLYLILQQNYVVCNKITLNSLHVKINTYSVTLLSCWCDKISPESYNSENVGDHSRMAFVSIGIHLVVNLVFTELPLKHFRVISLSWK